MSERKVATPRDGRRFGIATTTSTTTSVPPTLIADMSPSNVDLHYASSQPSPVRNNSSSSNTATASSSDTPTSTPRRRSRIPVTPSSSSSSSAKPRSAASHAAYVKAKRENDSMIYIDGPQVYTCSHCRTHLTSHDDIISKSFHGRHGRAYLLAQCVNVVTGPEEKRRLMTGLHVVCDIFCKRCDSMVGWTYTKAYEPSQKYKEGKFIVEKINLHLEESAYYTISHPAGERDDRWRRRSMSWGSERSLDSGHNSHSPRDDVVYEYGPPTYDRSFSSGRSFDSPSVDDNNASPYYRRRTVSVSDPIRSDSSLSEAERPPQPVLPDLSPAVAASSRTTNT